MSEIFLFFNALKDEYHYFNFAFLILFFQKKISEQYFHENFFFKNKNCFSSASKFVLCQAIPKIAKRSRSFNTGSLTKKRDVFTCEKSQVFINNLYLCDMKKDCPHGEDEENCYFWPMESFECLNSKKEEIFYSNVCNFIIDCSDGTDEINCGKLKLNNFLLSISTYQLPVSTDRQKPPKNYRLFIKILKNSSEIKKAHKFFLSVNVRIIKLFQKNTCVTRSGTVSIIVMNYVKQVTTKKKTK